VATSFLNGVFPLVGGVLQIVFKVRKLLTELGKASVRIHAESEYEENEYEYE
jgi:hypothetical protein